jgi:predicted nucleic acid-binding protein
LAAVFPQHPHHARAQEELSIATPLAPAVFCRATQQSFLRLITTPQILRAYAVEAMTNRSALKTFELLRAHPSIAMHDEPPGAVALWHRLAAGDAASPKVWMDAYLAAFLLPNVERVRALCDGYLQGALQEVLARVQRTRAPVRVLEFDCLRLGSAGVFLLKPEGIFGTGVQRREV